MAFLIAISLLLHSISSVTSFAASGKGERKEEGGREEGGGGEGIKRERKRLIIKAKYINPREYGFFLTRM